MTTRNDPIRILVYAIIAIAAASTLMGVLAWSAGESPWTGGWGGMMMGGMGLMMLVPILLVVLLIHALSPHGDLREGDDARGILERRYARGEVSREDYLRMKEDLERRP